MKDLLHALRGKASLVQAVLFLVMILSSILLYYLAGAGNQAGLAVFLGLVIAANLAAAVL